MCFHWVATFGFDGADVRKENRFKKKKKLSKEDETKEECYRLADSWVVCEEEKKKKMTFMTLGRGIKPI